MLNYNHLNYFHVAATEGTVAAAAERLGVTQPTVSEQIKALERALNVALFQRTPSGLRLTEAGKLAFEHTSVMFRAGERLVESLGQSNEEVPRTLRVGISSAVARTTASDFVMPLLALERCMPSIRSADSVELIRELRANELDLVICETEPSVAQRQGLEVTLIQRVHLVAVSSPDVKPLPDWQNVGLVHYRASSSYRWDVETYLDTAGLHPRIAAEADDAMYMVEAAARGGYVAFVSRSLVRDALEAGRLVVLAEIQSSHPAIHAVFQDSATADLARRAVEVLVAHVKAARE